MQFISLYKFLIKKMQQKWVSIGYLSVCIYRYMYVLYTYIYVYIYIFVSLSLSLFIYSHICICIWVYSERQRERETTRDKNIFDYVMHNHCRLLCHTGLGLNTSRFGRFIPLSYSKVPGWFCRKIRHWYKQKTTLNPSAASKKYIFGGI